jgi:hypothetical protein
MIKISSQQYLQRWTTLPDNLREAIFSQQNTDILWRICEDQHIPEEKIYIIVTLAGDVIFGFLHPEDFAKEIRESLNLNPEIANSIAQEIDRKIFSPIKTDLEKVYSPVSEIPETKPSIKPKPGPEPTLPIQPPAELPVVSPSAELRASPVEPKPIPLTELPKVTKAAQTIPKPPAASEVEPFILHEETEPQPVGEKKRVSFPAIGWFKKTPKTETPVKVELEIFNSEEKKPFDAARGKEPIVAKTEPPKQKVIHYREAPTTPFGGPPAPTPTPAPAPKPPKPEEPQPSPEATAGEAKVINLESFE